MLQSNEGDIGLFLHLELQHSLFYPSSETKRTIDRKGATLLPKIVDSTLAERGIRRSPAKLQDMIGHSCEFPYHIINQASANSNNLTGNTSQIIS